ncbi:hypothetical protein BH11BAC5_BH11BAC5_23900 [soil metagenome]
MDFNGPLYEFMDLIGEDHRIGPTHISLFMAILHVYKKQEYEMPVSVYSRELMKQAKISAVATYHKCLRDLKEAGYIKYIPSYNPVTGSLIYLM